MKSESFQLSHIKSPPPNTTTTTTSSSPPSIETRSIFCQACCCWTECSLKSVSNFIGNNCEPKWNVKLLNQPLLPLSCTSCGAAVFGVSCSAWEGGWGAYVCTGQIGNKMSKTPNRSFLNKICCRVSGFMPWCDFSVPRSGFSVPTWFSPAVLIGLKTIFSSADCTGTARSVPPLSPPEDRVQKPNSMNCMRPQTGIK